MSVAGRGLTGDGTREGMEDRGSCFRVFVPHGGRLGLDGLNLFAKQAVDKIVLAQAVCVGDVGQYAIQGSELYGIVIGNGYAVFLSGHRRREAYMTSCLSVRSVSQETQFPDKFMGGNISGYSRHIRKLPHGQSAV
jgi:hypothetical protein